MKIFACLYLGGMGLLFIVVIMKAVEEIKFRLGWRPEIKTWKEVNRQKIGGYRPKGCSEGEGGVSPRSGQGKGILTRR